MSSSLKFKTAPQLSQCINNYFEYIKGEYKQMNGKTAATTKKVWLREPEPPTPGSLAVYLGFNCMDEYKEYEAMRNYAKHFRYAKMRIEAAYEQLLFEKPTAAIFALKSMGWVTKQTAGNTNAANTLKVEFTNSGPTPATSEKEVHALL